MASEHSLGGRDRKATTIAETPEALIRIRSGVCWRRTEIRRRHYGLETELHLDVEGRPFSVAFDSLPETDFLRLATVVRSIDIFEENCEEPDGKETSRYRIHIVGGEPPEGATAFGGYVRWGPVEPA